MNKRTEAQIELRREVGSTYPQAGQRGVGPAARTRIPGLLAGLMLAMSAHGQSASQASPTPTPVPNETGYVIKFKVLTGKNAQFEGAIAEMMAGVWRKEPGNIYCDLYHSPQDAQTYVIVERYRNKRASKAHAQSTYIRKLGATLSNGLLAGPPEIDALAFMRSK